MAQRSRRGSITLPKLRIALRIYADDEPDGWECPHCGHIFWVASAWSEDDGETGGMLCPECGEFISNDELGIDED